MRPTAKEHHLLIELKEERILGKILEQQSNKKVVEAIPMTLSESSSKYDDVFYMDYCTLSNKGA